MMDRGKALAKVVALLALARHPATGAPEAEAATEVARAMAVRYGIPLAVVGLAEQPLGDVAAQLAALRAAVAAAFVGWELACRQAVEAMARIGQVAEKTDRPGR